jgi:hypothetical protein
MTAIFYRLAIALMRHVEQLTPFERRDWARAMVAEFAFAPGGSASVMFALGCLWTAIRLRAQRGYRQLTGTVPVGLLIGILFSAHSAVPDTQAWPLIWPAVGGAAAVVLCAKCGNRPGNFAGTGAKTGSASALVFSVAGVSLLWWVEAPDFEARVGIVGAGAGIAVVISALSAGLTGLYIQNRE